MESSQPDRIHDGLYIACKCYVDAVSQYKTLLPKSGMVAVGSAAVTLEALRLNVERRRRGVVAESAHALVVSIMEQKATVI